MTARSVVIAEHGSSEALTVAAGAVPVPGPGQLLVETEAAGVAYADVLMRRGVYPETPRLPFVPGYDVVGTVVARGPGVDSVALGARVAALTVTGGYSTHTLADAAMAVPVPAGVDAAQVSALTLNYVTAHQMLHRVAQVRPDDTVLVLGAAGGVGTALLELAARGGVHAIGTASGARTDAVTARGAYAVDRTRDDVAAHVRRRCPDGVAAVFDPVGGPSLPASRAMTARSGTVVSYGISFAVDESRGRRSALARHGRAIARAKLTPGAAVRLYVIAGRRGYADRHPDHFRADLSALIDALAQGRLAPEVTRFALDDAARAHDLLEGGHVTGKVALIPSARRPRPTPRAEAGSRPRPTPPRRVP